MILNRSIHYNLICIEGAIERKKNYIFDTGVMFSSVSLSFIFTMMMVESTLPLIYLLLAISCFCGYIAFRTLKEIRSLEKDLVKINKQLVIKDIIE
jgi:4-hydroxybenzoate polyprenyltransferase